MASANGSTIVDVRDVTMIYNAKNREKVNAYHRAYYAKNREKEAARHIGA